MASNNLNNDVSLLAKTLDMGAGVGGLRVCPMRCAFAFLPIALYVYNRDLPPIYPAPMKPIITVILIAILAVPAFSQREPVFTRDDSLRGSITPERAWWDLTYYELRQRAYPDDERIEGSTTIHYKVLDDHNVMQVDLQEPMKFLSATQDGKTLKVERAGTNAYFVHLQKPQVVGHQESVVVAFEGQPVKPQRPPWDGGIQWQKDKRGFDFIATSCQGLGASAWWACKDHMYDEPDSMLISITVPKPLTDVSNGRLRNVTDNGDGTRTFDWFVANPINNYGVNMNVAFYAHFGDTLHGENGVLDLDYFVLSYNVDRAKKQFEQVKPMLRAFEYWFGPYPFYEDGFKLVEVPYLGMEHQSSVTYGNEYMNGYLGNDLSGTGWGLKFDYIIIHESGHEWFANNITYKDIADMWVHEGFTYYSECLFVEYHYGKEAGADYIIGSRRGISNRAPIIGHYEVNSSGSGDMYNKGGNLLHTIRQIFNDDEKWRQTLRGLNKDFYHSIVTTQQVEAYISEQAGRDLDKVFDQYLRDIRIPVLEYRSDKKGLKYRWANCVAGFDMPMKVRDGKGEWVFIYPTTKWQTMKASSGFVPEFDRNFYVEVREVSE